uniref:Uncharacterized protein n=1 Tax=Euplotes crassus TaxID=5936 RepID=A0A7S3KU45_EUPCR|mmetsp:Transcript_5740/g.5437  ORF Transcript_5740/g.5437 Transcript_5740/m.5437 type:complete len:203 (+) Transcript_5740:260-868(+)
MQKLLGTKVKLGKIKPQKKIAVSKSTSPRKEVLKQPEKSAKPERTDNISDYYHKANNRYEEQKRERKSIPREVVNNLDSSENGSHIGSLIKASTASADPEEVSLPNSNSPSEEEGKGKNLKVSFGRQLVTSQSPVNISKPKIDKKSKGKKVQSQAPVKILTKIKNISFPRKSKGPFMNGTIQKFNIDLGEILTTKRKKRRIG